MTDEEFERLKEAEKEHLRAKKRLQARLRALKKRKRTEGIVQKMKDGAQRLLRETESLVDTLQTQIAGKRAQLEHASEDVLTEDDDDLIEAEAELREERAESLIRQYKAASGSVASTDRGSSGSTSDEPSASASPQKGPEKTIGRMSTEKTEDSSESPD